MTLETVATPSIVIDASVVVRNLRRMASYAQSHGLKLRPHTKTHKSTMIGRMQLEHGAVGLTVAKGGEAKVMAEASEELDLLMAYPAVDAARCTVLAELVRSGRKVRVAIDSIAAADALAAAARATGGTIGILIEIDVGLHRTGVQTPQAALELAQHVGRASGGVRLDGVMFYPGHIWEPAARQQAPLEAVDALLGGVLRLWERHGLKAEIVSGGSTPTAFQSHHVRHGTEIRPGTYVFNDMNCVAGGFCELQDCAARIVCTVVSDAVAGQVVIDAGTKTLTSDRRQGGPDAGYGHVVEYPAAKVAKLTEEHGQVDVRGCDRAPKVGERVTVIPNHICPCINLQDRVCWQEPGEPLRALTVDWPRGRVV